MLRKYETFFIIDPDLPDEVTVAVDEMTFEGASASLLGSVLAQFFTRYVSINSFTETVLRSDGRDEINRWAPQWGARPTV